MSAKIYPTFRSFKKTKIELLVERAKQAEDLVMQRLQA
jgi:hypothetical protein